MEALLIRAIGDADRICAGCNSRIAAVDPRWISEGQHLSNEAYSFHDNRCKQRMLDQEYADYLRDEKHNARQGVRKQCGQTGISV